MRESTNLLNLENITRDNHRSFDFKETSITEDDGLQCKGLLQFFDDRTGLEFLDETDTGVEQQESANDTEINPILETGGENGSSLEKNRYVSIVVQLRNAE